MLPNFGKPRQRKKDLFPKLGSVTEEKITPSQNWEHTNKNKGAPPKLFLTNYLNHDT